MARPKPNLTEKELKERSAKWVKKWRDNNPKKHKLARKRAYANRKKKAFLVIGGAICVRCGCDEIEFLEFNHIDGGGCKEHRDSNCKPMMDRILTKDRHTNDLECLCRICNALDYLERKNPEMAKNYSIKYELVKAVK